MLCRSIAHQHSPCLCSREAVSGAISEAPGETRGILVHGLYLEGCAWGWEEGHLKEEQMGVMMTPLPVLQCIPELR